MKNNTIEKFLDEMSEIYGLENLQGLGYDWRGNAITYAVELKAGDIPNHNLTIELLDDNLVIVDGLTDNCQRFLKFTKKLKFISLIKL